MYSLSPSKLGPEKEVCCAFGVVTIEGFILIVGLHSFNIGDSERTVDMVKQMRKKEIQELKGSLIKERHVLRKMVTADFGEMAKAKRALKRQHNLEKHKDDSLSSIDLSEHSRAEGKPTKRQLRPGKGQVEEGEGETENGGEDEAEIPDIELDKVQYVHQFLLRPRKEEPTHHHHHNHHHWLKKRSSFHNKLNNSEKRPSSDKPLRRGPSLLFFQEEASPTSDDDVYHTEDEEDEEKENEARDVVELERPKTSRV